ncbi:SPFH domain-containing protein [Paenibacillus sp. N1-5-1-14]|uniref:prohibitin family protein n=1 Tax=Paenibacillus radicibacter TaxID=2972488 RepID=UPI0021599754|nr:prohibitin family protein [Paenibacillus radicibacter]MCR8641393.1 SPFH domain-containing protein [Paenibacillus radicibacter]
MSKFSIGGIFLGALLFIGVIFGFMSVTKIEAGFAGVVYNTNGGIEEQTLNQGWHVVAPWKKVTEYPVSTETVFLSKTPHEGSKGDESFNVSTKEGKQVSLDVRYAYHMDAEKLPHIFTKFRGANVSTIEGGYLKNTVQATVQSVTSEYPVLEIYGVKRDEITAKVSKELTTALGKEGITIETFAFGEIRPDENTLKAIQDNVNAQQQLATLEIQKKQAEATADKQRIEAKGVADSELIKAQGVAKANETLKQSLTPELIQMEIAKKWDGRLPTVSGGNTPMIQLPTTTNETVKK